MMEGFQTPLPVPEFYSSNNTCYSTKKSRRTPLYRRIGPPPLTAPPACFSNRYRAQKPHRISFKSEKRLSGTFYDESKQESYFKQCFTVESKLGEGSFGKVYKARSKEDHRLYAVKKAVEPFRNESDRAARLSEVHKHEALPKHPNLVRFVKAWEESGCLYIQTELCKISLSDLCEHFHDVPESLIWKYLVDLLLAVKHLHDHDLIHMDIKPDNIFISEHGICKLGDFGLVCDLKKDSLEDIVEGDSKYLAPEVLQSHIGKHIDIFSLGITILEVSTDLDLPSEGNAWHRLREGDLPHEQLAGKSLELCNVIQLMLTPDYVQRPNANELLGLPCLTNVWCWRRPYVAYSQIIGTVKACLLLIWIYHVFFGRNVSSAKGFLRIARSLTRRRFAETGRLFESLRNGDVTKELKMDSISSEDESSPGQISDLSAICRDDGSHGNSFSTPPVDFHDDVPVPEDVCLSSPEALETSSQCFKQKATGRLPWNSTPASESRMRRRIIDVKSPNDLKRLRSDKKASFTHSPIALKRIVSQNDSFSDSSVVASPYTMPDVRFVRANDLSSYMDSSSSPAIPPKNLLDAFENESDHEVEL